jgi:archaellum component FlaC
MGEKKMVRRSVSVAVGVICIILAACLVGTFAYYVPRLNDENNTVSSLDSQIKALQNQILLDNSTINSLNSQIFELENQLASDNSTVRSDNTTIANLQSQVTTLQNQVKSLQDQITELSTNLGSLQSQYEQLNQTYTSSFLFSSSGALTALGMPSAGNSYVPQIFITYPAGFQEYADAILKICDTALSDYGEVFYMYNNNYYDRPLVIHIFIYTNASDVSLGTTPWNYRIYLQVRSIDDMSPQVAHHVYGFIHELGHITFLTDNGTFDEGWAHYAASIRILPEVYSQLGDDAWPQPYNYSQTEGSTRFLNEITNSSLTTPGTFYAAAKILYTIDQKYGPLIFKQAMDICHPSPKGSYNYPIYSLNEFKNALVSLTNDTSLLQLFEENGF